MTPASPFWTPSRHADRRPRLAARARLAATLRQRFAGEDFLEVEPAALQASPGNEAHLHAFATTMIGPDGGPRPAFLHTSPEFAMKKLLAAGERRIFALARVFRNRERGALHAPEFTMLEWYRAEAPLEALMADCAAILALAAEAAGARRFSFRGREADPLALAERLTLREAFKLHAAIDLFASLPADGRGAPDRALFASQATDIGVRVAPDDTWSDIFSRILSDRIEPRLGLGRPCFLTDYPVSQAALARVSRSDPRVAQRFELYVCGVELANAFGELTDPAEQRRRFEAEMATKQRVYGETYPIDEDFLAALAIMPEASGAALGFDRLVMLACGAERIEDVQWTPVFDPAGGGVMSAPTPLLAAARHALAETYGFAGYRPGQEEIVAALLGGEDVLAVMPTGAGKSLCFQLPALVRGGLTLVVSPLIALMRDQVAQLKELGVSAAALNSASDADERRRIAKGLEERTLRLLYVAPERLLRDDTLMMLEHAVDLFAVDEAHCVSQWGHDFRPEYLRLAEAARGLGRPQTIAVTATADAPTRTDIAERLFSRSPRVFVRSFDRPNLFLSMRPKANATRQLLDRLDAHKGESGIIYCASRRRTEVLAEEISERGRRALPYHAGLDHAERSRNQDIFLQEDGVVVCATIAFGMGIDKPDVRFVLHADMPSSIESYYQEIGRAGRDGLPAEVFALYGAGDIELRRRQIAESPSPDERKRIETAKLDDLVALCESARCRRQTLLAMFGEEAGPCGNCDVCQGAVRLIDGRLEAQKALSAVLRTSGRFFFGHLANILAGKSTEAVAHHGHDQLKTFGVGAERGPAEWRGVLRQLLSARLIDHDRGDRDRLVVTDEGRKVLRGEAAFALREDVVVKRERREKRALAPTPEGADEALLAALKALRGALAKAQSQPAYVVFPDRSLIEMAAAKPTSLDDLARIHGVGAAKLQKYGPAFLAIIRERADA